MHSEIEIRAEYKNMCICLQRYQSFALFLLPLYFTQTLLDKLVLAQVVFQAREKVYTSAV